jgi:CRISPR/Cas system-associated endoribonuclease Cas2
MSKYSIILSKNIPFPTKIEVFELCINGKSIFQEFLDEISENELLFNKAAGAIRIIENSVNGFHLPKAKFRLIEGHKLNCKIYEAKKDMIRVYMFHEEKIGRVIITGGTKSNQDKDISKVKKWIKEYQDGSK